MAFLNRDSSAAHIEAAEQELEAALEAERPEEIGAKLKNKEDEGEDKSGDIPAVIDGHNWKERYGNLQRFSQKKIDEFKGTVSTLQGDIATLKGQIETLVKRAAPAALPENDEDLEGLRTANPAAYKAIEKLARGIAEDLYDSKVKTLTKDFDVIRTEQKQNAKDKNWISLQKRHPDLNLEELNQNEDFHIWLQSKSSVFQDAMYGDDMNVNAASDVLDMWKATKTSHAKLKTKKTNLGNEDVPVKGTPSIPQKSAAWDFTESQIDEMDRKDRKWIEKNLEAIDKAARAGRILLDISDPSGSARRIASESI